MHELRTPRLLLRQWRQEDLAPYAVLNADPVVMEFFPAPLTTAESNAHAQRQHDLLDSDRPALFAVERRGEGDFIGFIGLAVPRFEAPFTPCVEIGWRLSRNAWGLGLATEGARAVLAHGFDHHRLTEIVSFTTVQNTRSRAVMERIGLVRDPAGDFDHPSLPDGHPLRPHVLYRTAAVTSDTGAKPPERV
ncbi:N-acetyltransferase [Nocardioides marmoriginsengisoli]|uniref:N-acetyltransferase n=1 Tax=Nocardioides marmoriginsengisoli TaxID=661483 RepID=A0A3N0CLK8_9ACTN|nr:GNAT family N-acetyltransferase [Nocardioides marmoriginsengisoli]RNL64338.1 N-acetyltransferase [Nocardioides marmoriginsengisoli]